MKPCNPMELKLIPLHMGFARHVGDWNFTKVRSFFFRIYYCTEGGARTIIGQDEIVYRPGYLYLVPPYTTFDDVNHPHEVFGHYYIHVYEDKDYDELTLFDEFQIPYEIPATPHEIMCIEQLMQENPGREVPLIDSDYTMYDNYESLMDHLREHQDLSFYQKLRNNALLNMLVASFIKHAKKRIDVKDERITKAIVYIRKHIKEPLSTAMLAEECFMTDTHFIRLFRKELGMPPVAYIKMKKIEAAQKLLAMSTMSVKEISAELSFNSTSYFYRTFKEMTGMTPLEYKINL